MSTDLIAFGGFVILFVLMLLRVPVGMAMGLVGISGYALIAGGGPALKLIGQTSMRTVTDYTFGVIPMFMLMGAFVSVSGVSSALVWGSNGLAVAAMSTRNGWPVRTALTRLIGAAGLPSTRKSSAVPGRPSGKPCHDLLYISGAFRRLYPVGTDGHLSWWMRPQNLGAGRL